MRLNSIKISRVLFIISSTFLFLCPLIFDSFVYSNDIEYSTRAINTAMITFLAFFLIASLNKFIEFIKEKPWACYFALMITAEISSRLTVNNYLPEIAPSVLCVFSFLFAVFALKNKGFPGLFYSFLAAVPLVIISYIAYYATGLAVCLVSIFTISLISCLSGWYMKSNLLLTAEYVLLCFLAVSGLFLVILSTDTYSFDRVIETLFDKNGDAIVNLTIRDIVFNADIFVPITKSSFCIDKTFYWYGIFNHRFIISFAAHNFGWIAVAFIIAIILIMLISGFVLAKQKCGNEKYASITAMIIITTYMVLYVAQNLGFAPFTIYSLSDIP